MIRTLAILALADPRLFHLTPPTVAVNSPRLPGDQISKGQWSPAELAVDPDGCVVQGDAGCQPGAQPAERVRSFPREAEGVEQAAVCRLDDLADPGQPPPRGLRPRRARRPLV